MAGEEIQTGEPNPTMSGRLPLASSPIVTATNLLKRTAEQNLDIMAEAMNTLTNRVADMQQQIGDLQQDKVNTSSANLEAYAQGGSGKNNFISPGPQPHVHPARPVIPEVPVSLEVLISHSGIMRGFQFPYKIYE